MDFFSTVNRGVSPKWPPKKIIAVQTEMIGLLAASRVHFSFGCHTGMIQNQCTPLKFNMEPENDGFQKESPFPGTSFQVPC